MADIDNAFTVDDGLSIDDVVGIFQSANDPTVAGEAAPVGSLLLRTTGQIYAKTGPTDTDWTEHTIGGGGTSLSVYSAHSGSTVQTVGDIFVNLLLGTSLLSPSFVTYNAVTGEHTINETGNYILIYEASADGISNSRTQSEARFTLNGAPIVGTSSFGYNRNPTHGKSVASCTIAFPVTAGQVISVQIRSVDATIDTVAESSRIMIIKAS